MAAEFDVRWHLRDTDVPKRVVLFASKEDHFGGTDRELGRRSGLDWTWLQLMSEPFTKPVGVPMVLIRAFL